MELSEQDIDLIERFLAGKLPADEQLAVEVRMQSEPEFAQAVEMQQDLQAAVVADGRAALKAQLAAIGATVQADQSFEEYKPSKGKSGGGSSAVRWFVSLAVIAGMAYAGFEYGRPVLEEHLPEIPLEIPKVDTVIKVDTVEKVVPVKKTVREEIVLRGRFNPLPVYTAGENSDRPGKQETWIFESDRFTFHYTFGDTLKLFGDFPQEMSLLQDGDQFILRHGKSSYRLERPNYKITPLKAVPGS